MKYGKQLKTTVLIVMFCVCILDSATAVISARGAIQLCLESLIPSLFPLMVLSGIAREQLTESRLLQWAGHIFYLPDGYESILLSAFFAGYPVGAAMIGSDYRKGILKKTEAQRLLSFCNNVGPAFIFGFLSHSFCGIQALLAIWFIQIYSAWVMCSFSRRSQERITVERTKKNALSESIQNASRAMLQLCGWVVIFKVLLAYISQYILKNTVTIIQVPVFGIIELSNGCLLLNCIQNENIRFLICCCIIAFGGFCVAMQTKDFIGDLSIKKYLFAKAGQAAIALLLSVGYLYLHHSLFLCVLLLLTGYLLLCKKNVDFRNILMYNQIHKDRRKRHVVS